MRQRIWKTLFWGYVLLMLWLLFGQRFGDGAEMRWQFWVENSVNVVPGQTISQLFRGAWKQWVVYGSTDLFRFAVINNLGNFVMFIPLGYGLPGLWPAQRHWRRFFWTVVGIILLIETLQLVTMLGSWDIDDILLNMAGTVIGFWLQRKTMHT